MNKMLIIFLSLGLLSQLSANVLAKPEDIPVHTSQTPQIGLLERVIDGDTFVSMGKIIRLWGIDAPEKGYPYDLAASLYLRVLLDEGPFSCYYKHTDRYTRLVMQCFSGGRDIARQMVEQGLAIDYRRYSNSEYFQAETQAKEKRLGIWKQSSIRQ